jgi:hypothetical protein
LFLSEQKKLEEKRRLGIEELQKKYQECHEEIKTAHLFGDMPSVKCAKRGFGKETC